MVILEASLGDGSKCCKVESSIRSCPISRRPSLGRLSRIKKVGRQNVIPHQAWIIKVLQANHVSRHYKTSLRYFSIKA